MCFNKKVLIGLAVVAVGVLLAAPELLGRALPLLFLAACPLSMVLMMRAMGGMGANKEAVASDGESNSSLGNGGPPSEMAAGEARERELEEEVNRLRAEIVQRRAGRS